MLRSLSIRNVVLVTSLDLDFSSGFNVLSGETGAGKSILLDALGLALGNRTDISIIREGCRRADVCAEFVLPTHAYPELIAWLAEHAFDAQSETANYTDAHSPEISLILRRILENTGRSKSFINGVPVTLTQLRELSSYLVDIHGQHAHQLLLKPHYQRQLLDRHAGLNDLVDEVKQHYNQLQQLNKAMTQAHDQANTQQREREQLEWQLYEFDKLAPQIGEWEQLHVEHHRLSHIAHLTESIHTTLTDLTDAEYAVIPSLSHLNTRLQELIEIDPALKEIVELINSAFVQAQEAVYSLRRYMQHIDLDPDRLHIVDTRLQALLSFARKYKIPPEQLLETFDHHRTRLEQLMMTQDLATLQQQQAIAHTAYLEAAKRLSIQRQTAAKYLAQAVTQSIQQLGMSDGHFEIAFTALTEGQIYGLDQIEFLVAGHLGAHPKPLAKVASGGELSRISLALSVITSTAHLTPTLIFDEVDAGIGGTIAEAVGRLLWHLGEQHQVLCVTHLAQIAALGHQHFRVRKYSDVQKTWSEIDLLDHTARIEEIARMLGGKSETARQHAQEMLIQPIKKRCIVGFKKDLMKA